jgi:alanine-synthesizing transaminase
VQLATPQLLSFRKEIQHQIRRRIIANQAFLDSELRAEVSPISRLTREAGWYSVLRVPASDSDESLAVELLEKTSVLLHPGHFFNFAQDGFLVASLIAPEEEFREGCRRLTRFFGSRR